MSETKYGSASAPYQNLPSSEAQYPPPAYTTQPYGTTPVPQGKFQVAPPDYLGLSIFTLLCCFWPLGLVGLIKSVETRQHVQYGRYAEAELSSREAKKFNKYGIIIGIVIAVIVWTLIILGNTIPYIAA